MNVRDVKDEIFVYKGRNIITLCGVLFAVCYLLGVDSITLVIDTVVYNFFSWPRDEQNKNLLSVYFLYRIYIIYCIYYLFIVIFIY